MDLALALDELQKARRYVNDGRDCLARQRKVVEWLEGRGHDALDAILFLEFLEDLRSSTKNIVIGLKNRLRLVSP